MKKGIISILAALTIVICYSCGKPNPERRTYESAYSSSSTVAETKADDPYLGNRLRTGAVPYRNCVCAGSGSTINVSTSPNSECDLVVIVKRYGEIVRNAYIQAGDSYEFSVPNGTYQVFFYGEKGWNPQKRMTGGQVGGFVANESYSKDDPESLDNEGINYELIPQQNGNFSTRQSSEAEMF